MLLLLLLLVLVLVLLLVLLVLLLLLLLLLPRASVVNAALEDRNVVRTHNDVEGRELYEAL